MAVPFHSIDFGIPELKAVVSAIFSSREKKVTAYTGALSQRLLADGRQGDRDFELFSSGRETFFWVLKSIYRPGDEIIFSIFSFPLYVKIARQLGYNVKLADIDDRGVISPESVKRLISTRTRAVVATHLFGNDIDDEYLSKLCSAAQVFLIEDCAQAFGCKNSRGEPVGQHADFSVFSTSLMKVPTTLGGGVLVGKKLLVENVKSLFRQYNYSAKRSSAPSYFFKAAISVLNSFPSIYTVLSHPIMGLLKQRSPGLLRKVLYSGMAVSSNRYQFSERPLMAGYQLAVGLEQLNKVSQMKDRRIFYARRLEGELNGFSKLRFVSRIKGSDCQYLVLSLDGADVDKFYDYMFDHGIHLMRENVWDCSKYGFEAVIDSEIDLHSVDVFNQSLVRIPNSSLLSEQCFDRICSLVSLYATQIEAA